MNKTSSLSIKGGWLSLLSHCFEWQYYLKPGPLVKKSSNLFRWEEILVPPISTDYVILRNIMKIPETNYQNKVLWSNVIGSYATEIGRRCRLGRGSVRAHGIFWNDAAKNDCLLTNRLTGRVKVIITFWT